MYIRSLKTSYALETSLNRSAASGALFLSTINEPISTTQKRRKKVDELLANRKKQDKEFYQRMVCMVYTWVIFERHFAVTVGSIKHKRTLSKIKK